MLKRAILLILAVLLTCLPDVSDARGRGRVDSRVNARVFGPDSDPLWIYGTNATTGVSVITKLDGDDAPIFALDVRRDREYPKALRGASENTNTSRPYYLDASGTYQQVASTGTQRWEDQHGRPWALFEEGATNYIEYSDAFDNAYWTKQNSSVTTVGAPSSPIQGGQVFGCVPDTTNAGHGVGLNAIASDSGTTGDPVCVYAIYKKGDATTSADGIYLYARYHDAAGNYVKRSEVFCDFSTSGVTKSDNITDAGVVEIGGGWYLAWFTGERDAEWVWGAYVRPFKDGLTTYVGDDKTAFWLAHVQVTPRNWIPNPIPTNGSITTTDVDLLRIPYSTWELNPFTGTSNEGTAALWWYPGFDSGDAEAGGLLLTADSNPTAFLSMTAGGGFLLDDGGGTASGVTPASYSRDVPILLICQWGGDYDSNGTVDKRIGYRSTGAITWGDTTAYDGEFTHDSYFNIGYDLFGQWHGQVAVWDDGSTAFESEATSWGLP